MCAFDTESDNFTVSPSADHDHHIMLLFKQGMTAFHYACLSDSVELVKQLIESGGDVMARDEVSNDVMCAYTYYMICVMWSCVPIMQNLMFTVSSSADHGDHIMSPVKGL